MAHSRRAQPESQLDVDLMILDYLLFMATKALLEEQTEGGDENLSELPLQMVNSFISIFKCNHPSDAVPDTTRFRLRLLKFTTLYGHRLDSDISTPLPSELQALRQTHRRRAEEWWDSSPNSPSFDHSFESQLPGRSERRSATGFRGTPESTALADLVPMFVSLSAARSEMQGVDAMNITKQWMELAGEFMLQAALEQCLVYGTSSSSKLREIFSWGWRPSPTQVVWEDASRVNHMFCEEGRQQEVEGWAEIRREYVGMLNPPSGIPLLNHLKTLTERLPLQEFEHEILGFMTALHCSQDPPLLAQLETGEVTGLSARETEALKQRIRFPLS